ncbi:MAG: hypothetical protein ACYDBB_04190 [Armatimonadota bacterium]
MRDPLHTAVLVLGAAVLIAIVLYLAKTSVVLSWLVGVGIVLGIPIGYAMFSEDRQRTTPGMLRRHLNNRLFISMLFFAVLITMLFHHPADLFTREFSFILAISATVFLTESLLIYALVHPAVKLVESEHTTCRK